MRGLGAILTMVGLAGCGGGFADLPQCVNGGLVFYGDGLEVSCAILAWNRTYAEGLSQEIGVTLARGLEVTIHRELFLDEPGETGLFDPARREIHLNQEGSSLLHELFHVFDVEVLHNPDSWRHAGWEEHGFNRQDAWYKARAVKLMDAQSK